MNPQTGTKPHYPVPSSLPRPWKTTRRVHHPATGGSQTICAVYPMPSSHPSPEGGETGAPANGRTRRHRQSGRTDGVVCRHGCHHEIKREVRICVDLTRLNESVRTERHSLPAVNLTLAQLAGARIFSHLDTNSGFWQIPLAAASALLTTFIAPFGRHCFHRLPFGISSAP